MTAGDKTKQGPVDAISKKNNREDQTALLVDISNDHSEQIKVAKKEKPSDVVMDFNDSLSADMENGSQKIIGANRLDVGIEKRPIINHHIPDLVRKQSWSDPVNGACGLVFIQKDASFEDLDNRAFSNEDNNTQIVGIEQNRQEKMEKCISHEIKEEAIDFNDEMPTLVRQQSWSNPVNGVCQR